MERTQVLTTSLDTDKASLGLSNEMFNSLVSCVSDEYTRKKRAEDDWNLSLFFNLQRDLERLSQREETYYEVWMDYWVLEEISHVVRMHGGLSSVELEAEISDSLREFDHLEETV